MERLRVDFSQGLMGALIVSYHHVKINLSCGVRISGLYT
jgi:hypothetical protein